MIVNRHIDIRPYTSDDWTRACEIHDSARRDELSAARLELACLTLEQTAENQGFHDYEIRVAEQEGQVVGFVAFTQEELAWLYVDPAIYRRGVGEALIKAALVVGAVSLHFSRSKNLLTIEK